MSNTEVDTSRKFVVPKLQASGWGNWITNTQRSFIFRCR